MGGWRAKKERCVLDTHFEVTVAAAGPLTGTRDGFVLPLPLGTCLGKLEWCVCPPGVREAQEGDTRSVWDLPFCTFPSSLTAGKEAEGIIIYLALCSFVLWGNAGADPSSH